mmetsp:Transcript_30380/g.75473  ORF Transcript_30380/g.75473 Transcript_30380/m.75473 type:complete len:144 (-) Transcript_30380:260-691(-)
MLGETTSVLTIVGMFGMRVTGPYPLGIRWKVNMDMSPIRGMPATRPSSDALSGLVAYSAVATTLAAARAARGGGDGGGDIDDTMQLDDALDISWELQGRACPLVSFSAELCCVASVSAMVNMVLSLAVTTQVILASLTPRRCY